MVQSSNRSLRKSENFPQEAGMNWVIATVSHYVITKLQIQREDSLLISLLEPRRAYILARNRNKQIKKGKNSSCNVVSFFMSLLKGTQRMLWNFVWNLYATHWDNEYDKRKEARAHVCLYTQKTLFLLGLNSYANDLKRMNTYLCWNICIFCESRKHVCIHLCVSPIILSLKLFQTLLYHLDFPENS